MLDDFPASNGSDREDLILDIVKNQQDRLGFEWSSLKLQNEEHVGMFFVLNDALKIDGIRINLTAATQQRIADYWGAMLLTAKLADLIWHNAQVRLHPCPRQITSSTEAMIKHSQDIDKQLENVDYEGKLISTVGKHWIIDSKLATPKVPNQAINYGWHFKGHSFQGISGGYNASLLKDPQSGMYWKMIQTIGTHHDSAHVDYSQICRLVTRECIIDGQSMDLMEVLQDPDLSNLVSHTGPQPVLRQPGVPEPNVIFVVP